MKKKILSLVLAVSLIACSGIYTLAFADDISEKQEELSDVEGEKAETEESLNILLEDIEKQQKEVDRLQEELSGKQDEINKTLAEIDETIADMDSRKEGLNDRLRVMYKNGSIGYLDIILGSGSLSELISNVEMIQRIYRYDQEVLQELKTQHEKLESQREKLRKEKAEIDEKKAEADKENEKLKAGKEKLQANLDELNSDADRISSEIVRLQAAQAEAAKPQQQEESPQSEQQAPQSNGALMWPCDSTYITSPFGYRFHPVTGIWTGHTGVDIGCPTGSPVYAAASGTVIIAEWYGGYGNAIVIDHGNGLSTLYGHNNDLVAAVGTHVEQGQVIAHSGSTGVSTGPHLHFEVRENGNYVDPMTYF